mmetsp:Transcript_15887/g.42760  ORF Transcript_15887/g.42760 Transcript_15887/m.42760 type:complete len:284 (+) Transcript_15887:617-1468(+)
MRPMSPTCAWPQLLGQPVQCMRTRRGMSSCSSRALVTRSARSLVSTRPWPQNCEPVHATRPRRRDISCSTFNRPSVRAGSLRSSSTRSLSTLGRMMFCSTVMRSSPAEYLSARSARARISATKRRPVGIVMPTQDLPSCTWGWTPMMSRRAYESSNSGAAFASLLTPRFSRPALTMSRIQSRPLSSRSHIILVFWRSFRSPWSRNTSRTASQKGTASSLGIHASKGTDSAARLMLKYPPSTTLNPSLPGKSGWGMAWRPMSLMVVCEKSSREPDTAMLNLRGR